MMPIPPYIRKGRSDHQDRIDYQAAFAKFDGSIAAPTAGLHFTERLINNLRQRRCIIAFVTLHVGTASFLPVILEGKVREPGEEFYLHSTEIIGQINKVRSSGGRVIAVGTTVVRALESMWHNQGTEGVRRTELFVTPGYTFGAIDGLVTNFHQPHTTHLLLVEALLGRNNLDHAYRHALKSRYRFLSYGDGMLIL
jgi:S-adenosylmethionine:tRNA ribosyltransferase-isomerase